MVPGFESFNLNLDLIETIVSNAIDPTTRTLALSFTAVRVVVNGGVKATSVV